MKIIFLDHFGVMCLAEKHGRIHEKNDNPRPDEMRVHGKFDNFDHKAVKILNEILFKTDAEIIVSSDWKRWADLKEIEKFYISQGIIKKPIDITPELDNINNIKEQRKIEILTWLKNKENISKWVAIDDMYLEGLNNFVWVSRTDEGITQKGIKEKMLSFLI